MEINKSGKENKNWKKQKQTPHRNSKVPAMVVNDVYMTELGNLPLDFLRAT